MSNKSSDKGSAASTGEGPKVKPPGTDQHKPTTTLIKSDISGGRSDKRKG